MYFQLGAFPTITYLCVENTYRGDDLLRSFGLFAERGWANRRRRRNLEPSRRRDYAWELATTTVGILTCICELYFCFCVRRTTARQAVREEEDKDYMYM